MKNEMNNPFDIFGVEIDNLQQFIEGHNINGVDGSYIASRIADLNEVLGEIRLTYLGAAADDITEQVMADIEEGNHVSDFDLEHTAKRLLVNVDTSNRQAMIDRLRSYF